MLASNLLQGSRVRLTALTSDDLPTIARWHQDAGFARLFDARPAVPKTIGTLDNWLDEYSRTNNGFVFAIRPLGEETLIGFIEIEGIMWAHQHAWISIAIGDSAHQGRGYGGEALGLALRFAFHELNLHRVQLTVFSYNLRAIALYEKLGFVREGVYREHLQRDGKRYDMYLYGLLRNEWLSHTSSNETTEARTDQA
jgi:RimJ/RimL family protein N-acetyltransferase